MRADYSRVTHPCAALLRTEVPFALDLHVLGLPPAFVLSQDQTLQFDLFLRSLRSVIDLFKDNLLSILLARTYACYPYYMDNLLLFAFSSSVFIVLRACLIPSASAAYTRHAYACQMFFSFFLIF